MYMTETVGIAELRQNLSKYLKRIESGERLIVTDRNKPVATLGPPPVAGSALDRLIAEGMVIPSTRSSLPGPLPADGTSSWTDALLDERGHDHA